MFTRNAVSPAGQDALADWPHLGPMLDGLAETSWLLRTAQLGLGFNPDLLALSERVGAQVAADDPVPHECRAMATTPGLR